MSLPRHRFDPAKRAGLLSAERWQRWKPPYLLALSGLAQDDDALDLGCGTGFWTLPISEVVGPCGSIVALDVSQHLLDDLERRSMPPNVRLLRCELPVIDLADESLDFIWAAFVVHEVDPVSALMPELRRVLRPGGRLVILEWRPDAPSDSGPPRKDRIGAGEVQAHLAAAGFGNIHERWRDADAYMLGASVPGNSMAKFWLHTAATECEDKP